jgi:hypothetical protein
MMLMFVFQAMTSGSVELAVDRRETQLHFNSDLAKISGVQMFLRKGIRRCSLSSGGHCALWPPTEEHQALNAALTNERC